MKQGAIFDMDGLLIDSERLYCENWLLLVEQFGETPDPAFPKAVCGTNGETSLRIIREFYPNIDAAALRDACLDRVSQILEESVPLKAGAEELLRWLKAHHVKLAVASSGTQEQIRHNMQMTGLLPYFDAVVSGEDVTHGKPDPEIFLLAAKRLGCAPETCYVFEDSTNGIRAAAAAGCAAIMIPDLTEPTEELRALASAIYPSLTAAKDAIARGVE